jgi:aspartate aminotransferase
MLSPEMLRAATRGYFIRKTANFSEQLSQKHGADKVWNLTLGNPRVPPPQAYFDALREVSATELPFCHGYGSPYGDDEAREAFADLWAELEDAPVKAKHVILASGCAGSCSLILRSILSPGDEVVMVAPFMEGYNLCAQISYGRYVVLDTRFEDGWQIDPVRLEPLLNPQTRAIFVNSPHNPTGIVYTQQCIIQIAELLARKSAEYGRPIWLLSDSVYARLLAPGVQTPKVFNYYPYTIIGHSLSKDLSIPGERIGCGVVNPHLNEVETVMRALAYTSELMGFYSGNRIHQRLIPRLLKDRITADLNLYVQSRDIICQMLDDCGIEYVKPQGAFYVFPKIPDGIEEAEFCQTLANKHLIVVLPGIAFHAKGFYRIAYCLPPDVIRGVVPVFKVAYAATILELSKK